MILDVINSCSGREPVSRKCSAENPREVLIEYDVSEHPFPGLTSHEQESLQTL